MFLTISLLLQRYWPQSGYSFCRRASIGSFTKLSLTMHLPDGLHRKAKDSSIFYSQANRIYFDVRRFARFCLMFAPMIDRVTCGSSGAFSLTRGFVFTSRA